MPGWSTSQPLRSQRQMNLFTDPKRSIIINSAVATVIILWLAGSFLVDAFSQRLDAVRLQDSTHLQNRLFDVAVALSTERLDAYSGNAQLPANKERESTSETTQPNSDMQLHDTFARIIESNQQIAKPRRQSTAKVNQRLMEIIEQEQAKLNAHREPNVHLNHTVNQSLNAHTAQIDRIKKLQSGIKYIPRFHKAAVDPLEQHRSNIQNLYTLLSLEATLLTASRTDAKAHLTEYQEELANAHGAQLPFWESIANYHTHTMAVESVTDKTHALIEIYRGVGSSGLTHSETNAQRRDHLLHTLDKLRKLDNYLSMELNQMVASSLAHANRRLFIDISILIACLLMILASVHVIRRLQHQSTHDRLTKLYNWHYFENELAKDIANGRSTDKKLAVISLDLEGFKAINDTLGYEVGDQILIATGERLAAELRPNSILARKSADEFAILQRQPKNKSDAVRYANELIDCFREPFLINDVELRIGSSIGISLYPTDAKKASQMLNHADIAMHEAKISGKDQINVFNIRNAEKYQQRIETERDLKGAIERNELELYYQPQVCARTGVVTGVEALIRWAHSSNGLVSPLEFIPIAEESGLMVKVGQWIMEEACANALELHKLGHMVRVAINISAVQFNQPDFVENVERIFKTAYFDLNFLELEVTESVVMNDMQMVVARLARLRDMGIHIAIDDFGTGYSSLSYLQDLPLDSLKIDRAFITALAKQPISKSVASTIVTLADTFELETVAEGVETDAQLHKVRELGCNYIQGYYYSKPVPLSELPEVIDSINQSASPQRKAA